MDRRNFCRQSMNASLAGLFGSLFNKASSKNIKTQHLATRTGGDAIGNELFTLPEGFSCRLLDQVGDVMSDGYKVPGSPDGMACFEDPATGNLVLMRNHELSAIDLHLSPFKIGQRKPSESYDKTQIGGVSRIVLNPHSLEKISSNLVLTGSTRNCAGGISPWGWLTCEETLIPHHGYVFLCDPFARKVQAPVKIPAYGRFNHEAATVHPKTLRAYLTEDRGDSCFYRFVPDSLDSPFQGKLQALKIAGEQRFDTAESMQAGDKLKIEWVTIDDPDVHLDKVREQGHKKGAAVIRRGEGLWLFDEQVYFSATSGGPQQLGQIFRIDLDDQAGDTLTLVAQSTDSDRMEMPDNLTVSPQGVLFFAEDGPGTQFVRMILPSGEMKDFAMNKKSTSEITGVCFTPDGQHMFLNLQKNGMTAVISGPFNQYS